MLAIAVISVIVIAALAWVFIPRRRDTYRTESGHAARLARHISRLDSQKHARRLSEWTK